MPDKALFDDADTISNSGSEGAVCCCVRFDCRPPYMYRTGAAWHGKLKTLILYGMMIVHVVWQDIPVWVSNMLNIGCIIMMIISLALYAVRNICAIRATVNKDA